MNFFDLHCDTPYECYVKKQDFSKNSLAVSGEIGKCFKKWTQTFAVWIKDDAENPFAREAQSFDWVDYKYKTKDGKIGGSGYKADEAFKKYKIRLVSWECAPPIENNFK